MDENKRINEQIESYYHSWFEMNDIYNSWAKRHKIQQNTLFALYVIHNAEPNCTQSHICNQLFLPKQTVSQILSVLEQSGHIVKTPNPNDRRNKLITLTEEGKSISIAILDKLRLAEIEAFSNLSDQQRESITESFKLLNEVLSKSFST